MERINAEITLMNHIPNDFEYLHTHVYDVQSAYMYTSQYSP